MLGGIWTGNDVSGRCVIQPVRNGITGHPRCWLPQLGMPRNKT